MRLTRGTVLLLAVYVAWQTGFLPLGGLTRIALGRSHPDPPPPRHGVAQDPRLAP